MKEVPGAGTIVAATSLVRRLLIVSLLLMATQAVAAPAGGRSIVLSFDDLPDLDIGEHALVRTSECMRSLTRTLSRQHVPAIGFVNEDKLLDGNGQPDPRRVALIADWVRAGLDLGNHTFSHLDLNEVPVAEFERDILLGERITDELAPPRGVRWFRHPYLNTGKTAEDRMAVEQFLSEHGYRVAPVTIDSSEWIYDVAYDRAAHWWQRARIRRAYLRYMDARFAWSEARSQMVFGREIPQVLLLHASSLNADVMPALLRQIRSRGYRFTSMDEAAKDPAYQTPEPPVNEGGVSWLDRWAAGLGIAEKLPTTDPRVDPFVTALAGVTEQ